MNNIATVAILGCGARGSGYGHHMFENPDKYKLVSICDVNKKVLNRFSAEWNIPKENLFTEEEEFLKEKRADILVIGTQDRDHVRMCTKALSLGYHILLEKPISPIKEELLSLLETHKKYPQHVVVCHVLRYAPAFVKLKQLLDSKVIGDLRLIEWTEQVAFWHQAHSFVRGNWRRDDETSPMIMQKCCHDLDLLQYYVGTKCDTVYSTGELSYFKEEFQPEGAADNCYYCKYRNTCPYSAEYAYIERWHEKGNPKDLWPFNVCCTDIPLTEEKLRDAYKNNRYGRCVFKCDNNVVDNQMVNMKFLNGVKVNLTMTGFTADAGRKATFYGTSGEIRFDEVGDFIEVVEFGKVPVRYNISELVEKDKSGYGHGGGDVVMVDNLYDMIFNKESKVTTSLEASVESHLMALCAEESRKTGKVIKVHE